MARWSKLAGVGVVVASGALLALACGSEQRARFSEPPPDAATETGPAGYAEGGARFDPCDSKTLSDARSVAGCHFFMTASTWIPQNDWVPKGCYALLVSNPSSSPASLRLRFKSRREPDAREANAAPYTAQAIVSGRDVQYVPLPGGLLQPGASAVVSAMFAPYDDNDPPFGRGSYCPTKAFVESFEPAARDELVTPAIELLSDVPVIASQVSAYVLDARHHESMPVSPYALFPAHLWDEDAVETGIYKPGLPATIPAREAPLETWPGRTFALAAFDDTHVLLPTLEGTPREITLQRGDAFSHTTNDSFAGRSVASDKPIGLITFAPHTFIDWTFQHEMDGADSQRSYSMALPSSLWGSEYVAARHADRWKDLPEAPLWRIIGGADDTLLDYDPYRPDGAPDRVAKGELAVFFADAPFVVRSQDDKHPFYFSQSMTGSRFHLDRSGGIIDDEYRQRGSAVTVHQIAISRWHDRYPFFAPMDFADHGLVLVRPRGGPDVRLDCAGTISGWQPVGDHFEYARVPLTGHLYEPIAYPSGTCQAGAHWVESDGPFSGTLWGWGNSDTYHELGKATAMAYALPLLGADDLPSPPSTN